MAIDPTMLTAVPAVDMEQASCQGPESGRKVNESGRGTAQTRGETRGCLQILRVYKWWMVDFVEAAMSKMEGLDWCVILNAGFVFFYTGTS